MKVAIPVGNIIIKNFMGNSNDCFSCFKWKQYVNKEGGMYKKLGKKTVESFYNNFNAYKYRYDDLYCIKRR